MAPLSKDSILTSTQKSELLRCASRDFLIDARTLVCPLGSRPNGMSRYYQIKVNSLLDDDEDDTKYILRISNFNVHCYRCGSQKKLRVKKRRRRNKHPSRKYCRFLRSVCEEYCNVCKVSKRYHLNGRQSILVKRSTLTNVQPRKLVDKQIILNPPVVNPKSSIKKRIVKPKPGPKQLHSQPKFSSRLRAFSCLLKE